MRATARNADLEGWVARLLGSVRPHGAPPRPLGTLRDWGLSSLGLTRLWLEVRDRFGVDLAVTWLAEATEHDLLGRLVTATGTSVPGTGVPDTGLTRTSPPSIGADHGGPHDPFPLSPLQRAYLVAKQSDLGTEAIGCHLHREFNVADVDPDRLRRAWQDLVERHEALRTVVGEDGYQRILPDPGDWTMPVHDLRDRTAAAIIEHLDAVRARLTGRHYPVGGWPSFAVEVSLLPGGHDIVHFSLDTLVTDAHGYAILVGQWHHGYHHAGLPPAPRSGLRDCVLALAGRRARPNRAADLAFWRAELADLPPGPSLVREPPGPAAGEWRPRRPLDAELTATAWSAVQRTAAGLAVSPTALVLEVFADALYRAGARRPFSLIVTTSDRPWLGERVDGLVGSFTSTAVHIVDHADGINAGEAAQAAHRRLAEHLRHGLVSGIEALRAGGGPRTASPVVFTSLLGVGMADGFGGSLRWAVSQTSDVALDHQMWEQDGGLRIHWDVDDIRFDHGAADTAFAALMTALSAIGDEVVSEAAGQLPALTQSYVVARVSAESPEGCQCYQSYEVADLEIARLEDALDRLTRDHDVLRAHFSVEGRGIRPPGSTRWRVPVIGTPGAAHEETIAALRTAMTTRPFPFGRWPSVDVRVSRDDGGRSVVHCAMDLVVGDALSIHTLLRDLWRYYADPAAAPRTGGAPPNPDQADPDLGRSSCYWHDRLAGLPGGPALGPPSGTAARTRLSSCLSGYRRLVRFCDRHGVRVDDLLLAAFTDALSRHVTEPFAVPVVSWSPAGDGRRPGEYSFMTWLRSAGRDEVLLDTAAAYRRQLDADLRAAPAGALAEMRKLVLADGRQYPVVYTALVDLTAHPLPAGVTQGPWATSTPGCAIDCVSVAEDDALSVSWDLAPDVLVGLPTKRLFAEFERSLQLLVSESKTADDEEGRPLRHASVGPTTPIPDDGPVQLLFERWTRERPDTVALRWRDGGVLSYGELNRRANRIAWHLRDRGVPPGAVVGVRVRRGPDMVAAVHGVLKAGAGYLPIDPALPAARAQTMLATTDTSLVLTSSGTSAVDLGVTTVEIDRDPAILAHPRAEHDPPPVSTQAGTAYVIFTSGSTGVPKGVDVTHRSVRNLLAFCAEAFPTGVGDLGLAVTSLSFDLSVFDMLGLLGCGSGVYLADEEQQRDPELLLDVLRTEPITLWNSAPTTLRQLALLMEPHRGEPSTTHLRLVLLSGDFIPLSLPDEVRNAFPNASTVALGGPTETTVWSNIFRVTEIDPTWRAIPYGQAIRNTRHYVLDDRLRPCPVGTEGELYTAGACLARGYRGAPGVTGQRFLPDPFTEPGERMFRTGDRGYLGTDGNLHIVGRTDGQVKIRGHRVELGEVEHCLRAHPVVRDVVVLARQTPAGDSVLVAYVITRAGPLSGRLGPELRAHAAAALPVHMVPNVVHRVGSFPATANGKLDRDALPWPIPPADRDSGHAGDRRGGVDLAELTEQVAQVFRDVLGTAVEVNEDLWDQGATSFTMVQVSTVLKRRWGQRVPVSALVSEPTVVGIARMVGQRIGAGGSAEAVVAAPKCGAAAAPTQVDLFSVADRTAFTAAAWNRRVAHPGTHVVALAGAPVHTRRYSARRTRREFLGTTIDAVTFGRFLSLLCPTEVTGRRRYLYPSAGDTYAVQTYLHLKPGAVAGLAEGLYYYDPDRHALHVVNAAPRIDRTIHFVYNRPVYDAATFAIYLIGQRHGIEPIYQDVAERFLTLEAGHMGQLLMTGQVEHGLGLCPIGTVSFDEVSDQFGLDDGHVLLHGFLGGPVGPDGDDGADESRTAATVAVTANGAAPTAATMFGMPVAKNRPGERSEVAVIGMAGRFPGADDVRRYWELLRDGRQALGPPPAGRLPAGADPLVGGFMRDVERFDSLRFRISPAEGATLDPQLRLLLETVWSCLEDAGHTCASLRETAPRVGVFIATMWQDQQLLGSDAWRAGGNATRSGLASDIPHRISHAFGFTGPSVAVNTSCSSSLTALHLAATALRAGECDAAVVGGANLLLHPYHPALLAAAGALAAGGAEMRAFSATSSGWCAGEGVAAVLLRPIAAARRAGDHLDGVVEATAIGYAGGRVYGRPDPAALHHCLAGVLDRGGLGPGDVDYVECAAAGAGIADAAELEALANLFADAPVLVGTVKPNIGHLESASGLSQLLKVLLQLRHGAIASTLVSRERNPLAAMDTLALQVPEHLVAWPSGSPARRTLINATAASGACGQAVVRAADGGAG